MLLTDDSADNRWDAGNAAAAAPAPVDEKLMIKRGQRTDMPKLGEKQTELEKVSAAQRMSRPHCNSKWLAHNRARAPHCTAGHLSRRSW